MLHCVVIYCNVVLPLKVLRDYSSQESEGINCINFYTIDGTMGVLFLKSGFQRIKPQIGLSVCGLIIVM